MVCDSPNMRKNLLTKEQKETRKRILEISYKRGLSHLGSCLSCVDLVHAVYNVKKKDEKFVLSNGHAAVALYVILEKFGFLKGKRLKKLHIHPDRNARDGIDVSTGSLGQGLPIAVGLALADRNKNVYCTISDGECAEGSIWEALRIASENKVDNLRIVLNANGWGAYGSIDTRLFKRRFEAFGCRVRIVNGHNLVTLQKALMIKSNRKPLIIFAKTAVDQFPFLKRQDAHYYVMKERDIILARKLLA